MKRLISEIGIVIIHTINCVLIIIIIIAIAMQWNRLISTYIQRRKRKKERQALVSYDKNGMCFSKTNCPIYRNHYHARWWRIIFIGTFIGVLIVTNCFYRGIKSINN